MILIVHRSEKDGQTLAEVFRFMGILATQKKPHDALSEISLRYSAVLLVDPGLFPDPEGYLAELCSLAPLPIFALTEKTNTCTLPGIAETFPSDILSSRLAGGIMRYCVEHDLQVPGDYRLRGIDARADRDHIAFLDRPVPLTRTEAMMLRFFIRAFPLRADAKEILSHVYRPSKMPEPSSVRTYVSSINRKFRLLTGENLIDLQKREGYRIVSQIEEEYPESYKAAL